MEENGYHGYENFVTWKFCLNVDNDGYIQSEFKQIAENSENSTDFKESVEDFLNDVGLYSDEFHCYKIFDSWDINSWSEIDFDEVMENCL